MTARSHAHGDGAPPRAIAFGLLTISDTRTPEDDLSGRALRRLVEAAGHVVREAALVPDDPETIRGRVQDWAASRVCEAIVTSGGTGLARRDRTIEAVAPLYELRIEGFGELFRALSLPEIGSRAMMTRASAGVVRGIPVFLLPGSPKAVELAMTRLILPEISHVLAELAR